MTPQTASSHPQLPRHFFAFVSALALASALPCPAPAQEPKPEPPAASPEESAKLPEATKKTPNAEAPGRLDDQLPGLLPPPGAIPILDAPRPERRSLDRWMENEALHLPPITDPPPPEPPVFTSPDLSREVAMSQALSTGDTLLGGVGGLGGNLYSPFLAGAPNLPIASSGALKIRPLRLGSLDVNLYGSLGVAATHIGGESFDDKTSAAAVFQGGGTGLWGAGGLSTIWFSYDFAGSYPDNPAQGQAPGSDGGSGGLDHNFSLMGSFVFPEMRRVKFTLGLKYVRLSGVDRDVGGNATRQISTALFLTSFQYNEKTSFSLDVSAPVRQFSDAVSSAGITSSLFVDTKLTRKTQMGLGYTFGSLQVEDGSDQIFQRPLWRVKYSPTTFLEFAGTAGLDFRDRGGSSTLAPIFGLSGTWDSQRGTLVTLAADRRVFNAASAINTNFISTSVVLSAYHRFDRGVIASITAGYEYTAYDSFGDGAETHRTDKLSYLSGGVVVPLTRHWSCSLSCLAAKKASDFRAFDFVQATLKTTLAF